MINDVINNPYGKFLVSSDDGICKHISQGKFWDEFLKSYIDKYSNLSKIALDIGANLGFHSIYMAKKFRQVHAFEPQRLIYYQLCGNIYLNRAENVYAYNLACYSDSCKMQCPANKQDQGLLLGLTENGINYDVLKDTGGVRFEKAQDGIEAITIDFLNFKDVGLIKIDAEGADLHIMKGAKETIKKNKPVLLFETHCATGIYTDTPADYFAFLTDLGYKWEEIAECNYFAIPK